MARKTARRRLDVFSLSFLDAMTCGFGAVVLFFLVINAAVGERAGRETHELRAEVDLLERQVLEGHAGLVELRNAASTLEERHALARGLSQQLISTLSELEVELATFERSTLARRESIERLQSDLRTLEEEARRLAAAVPKSDQAPGDRVRAFVGDGDRQYLTGLKVGGRRIAILVDASASMLDETIVNVVRRRNLPEAQKLRSPKWRRALRTVDWLLSQLPAESSFQLLTFAEAAGPVVAESAGGWLAAGDRTALDDAAGRLGRVVPAGGTSLALGLAAAADLRPPPDNLILLTDGLPTRGAAPPRRRTVSAKERLRHFDRALEELPRGLPVNVVLFPMEGDPMAASAFWKLAVATRGSFLSPPEDWP